MIGKVRHRVVQFVGSFNEGGSERQALALTRRMADDGRFEVSLATLNASGVLADEASMLDVGEIGEFPLNSFYDANFVRQVRRAAKYLRSVGADVVHTHDFYTNVFGIAAARLAGVTVKIASKRETGGMRSPAQAFVEKIAFERADAVIVNSAAVQTYLTDRGVNANKLQLIYNGLDIDAFDQRIAEGKTFRENLGFDSKTSVVTIVANLRHTVKNIPMLLRAAAKIVRQRPDTHFVIAGEGELRLALSHLAEELGIAKNIHFIGRCENVPALTSASDICVLTSDAEGFSNSILEYMAAAKPVIATNVGGAAEAIADKSSGFLIEPDDDASLADKIEFLLANPSDAAAFGKKGREIVEAKFSAFAQIESTIALYDKLLTGKK